MMEISLDTNMFPQLRDGIRAQWAPVFFEPISGSYERFVVGVAAFNDRGFHLEWANQLDRLTCFYGANARGVISAIQIAGEYLQEDLAKRAGRAISEPDPAVSGIAFGETREAEGNSLEGIAQSWMAALSSLYHSGMSEDSRSRELVEVAAETEGSGDRLPFLVCEYVKSKRVGFADFFSLDLRENKQRRAKKNSTILNYNKTIAYCKRPGRCPGIFHAVEQTAWIISFLTDTAKRTLSGSAKKWRH